VGNIEDAALKGRRYTRKKKKEAGLKSRPYTVGVEVEIEEAGFGPSAMLGIKKPALHIRRCG